MTPLLQQVLETAGRQTRPCRYCGRVFDPATDHQGRAHAPQRLYCSPECRALVRTRRQAPRRRERRAHDRAYAGLAAMHQREAAGQLAIGDPLPPVPPLPQGVPA